MDNVPFSINTKLEAEEKRIRQIVREEINLIKEEERERMRGCLDIDKTNARCSRAISLSATGDLQS